MFNHIVVGIDQSLTGTGLALLRPGEPHAVTCLSTKTRGAERLFYIENAVSRWAPDNTAIAVMEGYAMGIRAGQVFSLGELGWAVKRSIHLKNIPLICVAPGTLKKYVTGSGAAKKNVMLLAAYKKFGVSFEDDNECDAYSLARIGHDYLEAQAGNMPAGFKDIHKAVAKYNAKLNGGDTDD